jgi:hypothetical protein
MEEIFNKLIKAELTPNSFYVLYSIYSKIKPYKYVNSSLEVTKLKQEGWLEEDLSLSSKSIIFITEIDGFFKRAKKKTTKDLLGNNFTDNIQKYVEIFPNRKLSSGKYARVNPKNLENSFRWFFENYDYDWDMIFIATKKYIYDYSLKNYDYMRTSQYFIRKQNNDKTYDSELADYCNMIDNVLDDEVVFIKERRL